ncbi:hypothetical protein E2C01_037972 [Portunus trituberculatus]|uniref:Uncharacterized protein n=1 Tax=Portunus trituberculatus TaxID=210409 RepID=A0A5B7F9K3_PORTR|nr:hypothetical protein [Portunus trituberculatus]
MLPHVFPRFRKPLRESVWPGAADVTVVVVEVVVVEGGTEAPGALLCVLGGKQELREKKSKEGNSMIREKLDIPHLNLTVTQASSVSQDCLSTLTGSPSSPDGSTRSPRASGLSL